MNITDTYPILSTPARLVTDEARVREAREIIRFYTGLALQITNLEDRASRLEQVHLARGEQPDSLALPNAGALRGDFTLSISERSEA